ncbi:MAG: response regulator [Anaerolineae bacterium]|jgi:two-component system sensor histidine kinase BarA|nr:response regulator [Anaerolineae bacterium]
MPHILVVDDDPINLRMMEHILMRGGHSVASANSGLEAITMAALAHTNNTPFDLALVDYMMPVMNGIELTQRLHELDPALVIIMLTAESSPDVARRGKQAGAQQMLYKPIRSEEMLKTIQRLTTPGLELPPGE